MAVYRRVQTNVGICAPDFIFISMIYNKEKNLLPEFQSKGTERRKVGEEIRCLNKHKLFFPQDCEKYLTNNNNSDSYLLLQSAYAVVQLQ